VILDALEGQLSEWDRALRSLIGRVGCLFFRPEPREVFTGLVEGLLSDLEKKNSWTLAQRAGHTHPGRMQSFLCRGAWSAQGLEAEVRRYLVEELGSPEAVLIVDDTQIGSCQVKLRRVVPQPRSTELIGERVCP
jgi:SRSO17 transposase